MAEKETKTKTETKKMTEKKPELKTEESKVETKVEAKPEEVKKPIVVKVKKEEAIARGLNLHASLKHLMYISRFIKNKSIDSAIADLEQVIKLRKAVPFKGEIPHRSEPGIMSGRYPVNSSKALLPVLKTLKGNAIANLMDLDKTRITFSSPSWASRPSRRGGGRFKRVNILIKASEVKK